MRKRTSFTSCRHTLYTPVIFILLCIILGFTVLLTGCGFLFDKCGDSELIGEFTVDPISLENWLPDGDQEQWVFTNSDDEQRVLIQVQDSSFYQVQSGKTICYEDMWDTAYEFIRGEWIVIIYADEDHEVEMNFFVTWPMMNSSYELSELFDAVTFFSRGENMGGTLDLVASDRGNDIDPDILTYPSYIFADTITINGVPFEDVWYFNREYPSGVFTPTLYVKEGMGVLAFVDDDNVTWLKDLE
jgi:hypothetical protein